MRDKLEAAWNALYPETGFQEGGLNLGPGRARFRRLLDAEAWLDAVMMLVPEGWECALYWNMDGFTPEAQLETEGRRVKWLEPLCGRADTPAEALLSAILKAKEQDHAE